MAKRLTSRLSAGAALVTGIGMMGIATAAPAQADVNTELNYTCSVTDLGINFQDPWKVDLTVGTPDQVDPGAEIPAPEITAEVTPGADAHESMRSLNILSLEGTATTNYTFDGQTRTAELTIPHTDVPAEGTVTTVATGTGQAETAPAEEGEVEITAGDFTAALTTDTGFVLNLGCTAPADNTVGTIPVGDPAPPEPEVDDWFDEPGTLPIVDNVVTVSGEATHPGTLTVQVLAEAQDEAGEPVPGDVLTSYTMNATEGANEQDFELVEGAGYVRLISQECVDAQGNDETVVNSGCNATYEISWVDDSTDVPTDPGTDEPTDPGTDPADDGDDADTTAPEIPEVVQTDGLTPAMTSQEDSTGTLALGGLLLAGAGAGTVLVMRRRAQQH